MLSLKWTHEPNPMNCIPSRLLNRYRQLQQYKKIEASALYNPGHNIDNVHRSGAVYVIITNNFAARVSIA